MSKVNVVVVGGGLSGLSAATYLAKHGIDVIVLEARDRVGGRTCSEYHGAAKVQVDVGGAYVGGTQDRILRLADEFGVATFPVHKAGINLTEVDGMRVEHKGVVPPLSPLALLDFSRMMIDSEDFAKALPDSLVLTTEQCKKWDDMTVEEWIKSVGYTHVAREGYRGAVKSILCVHPAEVSMLYWLNYIKQSGCMQLLTDNAQDFKFVGGSQSISDKMAAALGKRVLLNSPVSVVQWHGSGAEGGATVRTRDGREISCDYVILAVAPTLYGRMQFSPPLPPLRSQLTQRMPMGCIIKTNMYYERAWWREAGYSGVFFSNKGPVTYTYDDCKPDGSHPSIMAFVLAEHAREWTVMSVEERQRAICAQFASVFRNDAALHPTRYVEKDWTAEEFSGGCYVGSMPPRVMSELGHLLREPMGCVHFAGTETARIWTGYMDGAVEAGERAAYEVALRLCADAGDAAAMSGGSLSGDVSTPRAIVPPEAPGVEPPNVKIPHPPIISPSKVERLLPGVPGALMLIAGVVAGLGYLGFRALSGGAGSGLSFSAISSLFGGKGEL